MLIIAAILVVAAGIAVYFIVSKSDAQKPHGGLSLTLDENMKAYTGREPDDMGGEGIKIPGYGTVTLPAGTTDVKMILLNPEGNPCYFTFELVVDGETRFTSNLVEPAMCIEDLKLTKPLKKGRYTAILKLSTYSLDESLTPMNGANVEFDLVVV
jgi:hypothetical protein